MPKIRMFLLTLIPLALATAACADIDPDAADVFDEEQIAESESSIVAYPTCACAAGMTYETQKAVGASQYEYCTYTCDTAALCNHKPTRVRFGADGAKVIVDMTLTGMWKENCNIVNEPVPMGIE